MRNRNFWPAPVKVGQFIISKLPWSIRQSRPAVDRAEAGAEVQRAGAFFLHLNGQIFAARNIGIFRISFDFRKVTKIIETILARVHADGVENIARSDQNFAPDHLILGACVADDIDALNERARRLPRSYR